MKRRQFVKNSGLIMAGLSVLPNLGYTSGTNQGLPNNWVWLNGSNQIDKDRWKHLLERLRRGGFDGIACNGSDEFYLEFAPLCKEFGIQLHTWRWTVNRGNYKDTNPEWYAVNRNGENVWEKPPYVHHYRWLCPSREGVRKALTDDYVALSKLEGISGVHLDYVRYCDIILPIGLQPKYNLVQDHEMAEFDYCYCDHCREKFEGIHGYDPKSLDDPSKDSKWHQFRLDQVVELVDDIVLGVHQAGSVITGAVFPTPAMSRRMVRQDWSRFNLDAYLPMLYHNYYLEDTHWISNCIAEARTEVSRETPIYAGMMMGRNFDPKLLVDTYHRVIDAGGNGLSIFTGWSLDDHQIDALSRI